MFLDLVKEKKLWQIYLLKTMILIPLLYPLCGNKDINLYDNDTLINLVIVV